MAGRSHDQPRRGDERSDRPSIWPRRAAAPPCPPILVLLWRSNGHGLASSGITTSVIGALKRGLAPLSNELGLHFCGGRGKHSRQTPQDLVAIGERVGFDGSALASRVAAPIPAAPAPTKTTSRSSVPRESVRAPCELICHANLHAIRTGRKNTRRTRKIAETASRS